MHVCVTSEEHALAEVTSHVIHTDGLNSEQVENIRRDRRNDSLLNHKDRDSYLADTHWFTWTASVDGWIYWDRGSNTLIIVGHRG